MSYINGTNCSENTEQYLKSTILKFQFCSTGVCEYRHYFNIDVDFVVVVVVVVFGLHKHQYKRTDNLTKMQWRVLNYNNQPNKYCKFFTLSNQMESFVLILSVCRNLCSFMCE